METRSWVYAFLLTVSLIGFSMDISSVNQIAGMFFSKFPNVTVFSEFREMDDKAVAWLKNTIQTVTGRNPSYPIVSDDGETSENSKSPNPFGPDPFTCHKSVTRRNLPVYCCPPEQNHNAPIYDFEFPSSTEPVRIRRPAHMLSDDYIAKYEKALQIMKNLSSENPHSFMRQANLHCIYCTGAYNQKNSSSIFSIHRTWFFFPWHRAFIYFHERIIGKLIDDPNFALPYWNWDSPRGMSMPSYYLNGSFFDQDRNPSHFPPKIADLDYHHFRDGFDSGDQVQRNLAFMYRQMLSGAKKAELFMGCKYRAGEDGFCDGPGTVELAPHNALHVWVGSTLKPFGENMGAFYSAARDPIFYAHHANIDRVWTIWNDLRGQEPAFTDPDWLDSYFIFHDENSRLVRIRVRDCLDITKLRYSYEPMELPWLKARPKPSIEPRTARLILKKTRGEGHHRIHGLRSEGWRLDRIIRTVVKRPKRERHHYLSELEEVLVVYGIDVKSDMFVKFDVMVNAVDEEQIGPESSEFAGTFVNVMHGVKIVRKETEMTEKKKRKSTLKLGISELLTDLQVKEEEIIWVSLVPRGGTGFNTTVDGVKIELMR